jgi:hypothetical protein
MPKLHRAPKYVIGYHGCTEDVARRVVQGESFLLSENAWDWLGQGVYFWEYAPFRAREWANFKSRQTGENPAVLEARIQLGVCLNMLDTEHTIDLDLISDIMVGRADNLELLQNNASGGHFLDRAVIDGLCDSIATGGTPVQTVRGCFPEGEPLFPTSKILRKAHVQIAARDLACLGSIRMVE